MKNSKEVLNLPIISISEGNQIGNVKGLIINPDKFAIDFLTVEQEEWQVSLKAIPFKKVIGIGEYAVTVEHDGATIDLNEIPIANQLLNKKIGLIGSRVMTRKGELLGEILEYFLNEENGQLLGLGLKAGGREVFLPIENAITLGKELVIVNEYAKDSFLEKAEQLFENTSGEQEEVKDTHVQKNQIDSLKSKQAELLKGKIVTKDIYDKTGSLLIAKGNVLKEEHISAAQNEGPSVFVELSMNVKE